MLDVKKLFTKTLDMFRCDLIYDGSYTSGSASLSKSVATYKRIKILYIDNDNTTHTKEIINNNGNFTAICDVVRITGEGYWKNMIIDFSGSSMWSSYNRQKAGTATPTSGTYVTVKKIYGYRSLVGGVLHNCIYVNPCKGVAVC